MLFQATLLLDLCAMAITLWMAFYLFAKGFPSQITLRAVIVLFALSAFFFGAYNNLFHQIVGTAVIRAILLIIGLGTWYSLTFQLMSAHSRKQLHWLAIGIYILGAITAILLISRRDAFVGEVGNPLYVARMGFGLPYILYGIFQSLVSVGILYNLLAHNRIGLTQQGRYFLLASIFPIMAVGYGVFALTLTPPMPRLIQDLLIFSGVFLLGVSVARHQTLVERRTTFQDFPFSGITVLGLSVLYTFLGLSLGLQPEMISAVVAIAILTHSLYDLVREFLERLRIRHESAFRRQLRQLENESSSEEMLEQRLQEGLDLLCQTLNAFGGIIAIRREDQFFVAATRQSIPVGSRLSASSVACDDVSQPKDDRLPDLAWIAPSFEGQTQVAVVGIGKPKARLGYSAGNLELLAEVADQVGTLVSLSSLQPQKNDRIRQLFAESQANASELNSIALGMTDTMATKPDPEFVKIVEEGLRHLPDYIALGQSALAARIKIKGDTHIERGRRLHQLLIESIENLRPAEKRPSEPLPRVWYNHAVLYDAYVEGVPNREIMARLYISEGTFNRTRRNALRGLARLLVEKIKVDLKMR